MFNFHHFRLALSFYTRLPVGNHLDYSQLAHAITYLPLIGWLVGGVSAGVFYCAHLIWPVSLSVLLAIIAGIFLTGGFHEDGLADCCDGFGGGYEKTQILQIMKDPRMGAYGGMGLSLALLLKLTALQELPVTLIPFSMIASHSLSRFAPLYMMSRYNYARIEASKSQSAVAKPNRRMLCLAGVTALLPLTLLPIEGVIVIIPLLIANMGLGHYFYRHIGGYTGDCLGASQQVSEVVIYLTFAGLWTSI